MSRNSFVHTNNDYDTYYMPYKVISSTEEQKIKKKPNEYLDEFKSFMQSITTCQKEYKRSKKKSRTIVNIKGQVMEPVGDAELETEFIQTTTENLDEDNTTENPDEDNTTENPDQDNTTSSTTQNQLNEDDIIIYKRDFMILNIFESDRPTTYNNDKNFGDNTKYTTFGVYALSIGATTKVMTLKIPVYSDIAILDMYDSSLNPYDIINITYQYQTSRNRSLVLKRAYAIIKIPKRDFLNNIDLIQTPCPDNLLSTDINYDETSVPTELMDLAILIRSNNYISNINHNALLEFALNITIF